MRISREAQIILMTEALTCHYVLLFIFKLVSNCRDLIVNYMSFPNLAGDFPGLGKQK
jgi:hypothetical protein